MNELRLSRAALREACHAWQTGGTLALGAWLAHYKPRFSTHDYGELVAMVRVELGDDHDYSQD